MKKILVLLAIVLMLFTACKNPSVIQIINELSDNAQNPSLSEIISEESDNDTNADTESDLELIPAPSLEISPMPSMEIEPMPSLIPTPTLVPLGEDAAEKYLGKWIGFYNNNSGKMNLEIDIYMVDMTKGTSNVWARFDFSPGVGNTNGKSGEYKLEGDLNIYTGEVSMHGTQWISANPENYSMLNLSGIITDTTFDGLLERDYLPEFYLNRY